MIRSGSGWPGVQVPGQDVLVDLVRVRLSASMRTDRLHDLRASAVVERDVERYQTIVNV